MGCDPARLPGDAPPATVTLALVAAQSVGILLLSTIGRWFS
jgi:hypothetical protein